MKFCPKCNNLLVVNKKRNSIVLYCRKCKKVVKSKGEKVRITELVTGPKREIVIMEKDEMMGDLPKTKIMCPKCENMEAFWWMQQTRAADEPPTMFYKCTKCKYAWRSYG
jgi:DNA-directed RNA polymerase subunit M